MRTFILQIFARASLLNRTPAEHFLLSKQLNKTEIQYNTPYVTNVPYYLSFTVFQYLERANKHTFFISFELFSKE